MDQKELYSIRLNAFRIGRIDAGANQNEEYRKLKAATRERRLQYEALRKELVDMENSLRNDLLKDQPVFPEYALFSGIVNPLCLYINKSDKTYCRKPIIKPDGKPFGKQIGRKGYFETLEMIQNEGYEEVF